MKRVRKVMDRTRPGCLIDFHSGNEFPFNDLRISPANKYMEHFPYLDSLWSAKATTMTRLRLLLVEISGIPSPVQRDAREERQSLAGMVYGMTRDTIRAPIRNTSGSCGDSVSTRPR